VLCLDGNDFSDLLGFAFVTKLPSLEKLDLLDCRLTSACLNTLSRIEMHKSLRELVLHDNDFSASLDLVFVEKLPSLEKLNLSFCNLTPESKSRILELMKGRMCIL